jgi:hypothetical protein
VPTAISQHRQIGLPQWCRDPLTTSASVRTGLNSVTSSVDEAVNSLRIVDRHATLLIDGASTFSDALGFANNGTLVVDDSVMFVDTSNTNSTLSNVGNINLDKSSLEIGFGLPFPPPTVLLTGGGHINLSGGEIFGGMPGVTVVSDNTISGTGSIDFSAGGQEAHGTWINQGIIDASTPNGLLFIGHTIVENSGILEATNGGLLEFVVAPIHNAAQGVIEAKGVNSEVIMSPTLASGHYTNAGLIAAIDSGTVLINDPEGGILDNTTGTIEAGCGSTVAVDGTEVIGGFVTILKGGLLEAGASVPFGSQPGFITGAVITNAGTIGAEGENLTINGDLTNRGTLDANNATLEIDGTVNGGKVTIEGTGEIVFGGPSSADVRFGPSTDAILKLEDPATYSGAVFGLTSGTYLDLTNINFANNPTISYSSKTHLLTVTDTVSGITDTISMKNVSGSFTAQSDGNGGTLITDPPPSAKVAVSNDAFVFASNLGENPSVNFNAHNDGFDSSHSGFADLAAMLTQAHEDGMHLVAHDAVDVMQHHAALSAQSHHVFAVTV